MLGARCLLGGLLSNTDSCHGSNPFSGIYGTLVDADLISLVRPSGAPSEQYSANHNKGPCQIPGVTPSRKFEKRPIQKSVADKTGPEATDPNMVTDWSIDLVSDSF